MKSGESRAGRPFQIVSLERRSDTHLLICSRRSTFFHLVWNVQWQAVGKERGKSVNIKNTNAKRDTELRRTLRSWRHTVVSPSSDKHSFGNNFANLKTCEVWKWFSQSEFLGEPARNDVALERSEPHTYLRHVTLRCCSMQLFPDNSGNSVSNSNKLRIFTVWRGDVFFVSHKIIKLCEGVHEISSSLIFFVLQRAL